MPWSPTRGSREGWWGASPSAEAFLDQLVTWRELGYNTCRQRGDHDRYESLPAWALETLDRHAWDPREQRDLLSMRTAEPLRKGVPGRIDPGSCLGCHQRGGTATPWYAGRSAK